MKTTPRVPIDWRALTPVLLAFTVTSMSAQDDPEEQAFELTPFEVSTTSDVGYLATQTLAGTRIRTDLRDVGSAISVITEEFLQDVGATDNSTLLQYTTNTEVGGTRSTYTGLGNGQSVDETDTLRATGGSVNRVRGLSEADNTRDFFVSDIPWDTYNVNRVDIQRGPNSILFGLGKPGGMVNYSLDQAEFFNSGDIALRFGSYGSRRASIDINQQLIDDVLAVRVEGLWDDEKFRQEPAFEEDERIYAAVRFDPQLFKDRSFRTSIKANYEHGEIRANRPRIVPPTDHVSPWFRPAEVSEANPFGGMGQLILNTGYETENESDLIAGDNAGQTTPGDPDYNPWIIARGNQQQPIYIMDGVTNHLQQIYGGYVNGYRNSDGTLRSATQNMIGQRYSEVFYGVAGLPIYAVNAELPGYQYGQHREESLTDASVFDFYDKLIDGPNKSEWENWEAYNVSLTQTAFNDRLGVDLTYDYQEYDSGGQSFLGGQPTLEVDILRYRQDLQANPNVGRPFVRSSASGSSYYGEREYKRGSLYGEFRSEDIIENDFFRKLIGRHRLNGVYADESYLNETRTWNQYGTSSAFNDFLGINLTMFERPPESMVYLGSSLLETDTASGVDIPRLRSRLELNDGAMYHFNPTWVNYGVPFDEPWDPQAYPNDWEAGPGVVYDFGDDAPMQNSNWANYTGWNSDYYLDILRYGDGDRSLTRSASKTLREVESLAATIQSYWWDGAVVTTLGWRTDKVKSKEIAATAGEDRGILDLSPGVYELPDEWSREIENDSFSWGAVVHLNELLDHDPLPLNVSVSYNTSDNFEVGGTRRNLYGEILEDPTGETEDYGITLSTKDNRFIFRVVRYESSSFNTETPGSNMHWIGNIISRSLAWRNVFLYNLGGYTLDTANTGDNQRTPAVRYNYEPAPGETDAQAEALENEVIQAWNDIQANLPDSYYDYWGWGSRPPADLSNPRPEEVYVYPLRNSQSEVPPGLTLTSDTQSEGYEFEFTANPTSNWRITFNASRTEATRTNVGGEQTIEFVNYMTEQLNGPAGDLRIFFGNWNQSNTARQMWNSNFLGSWTLLQLLEGSDAPEIREWNYNIVTNYTFDEGTLKGLSVGGGYRWQDKVIIGYPVVAVSEDEFSFDLSKPYHGPSEDAVDLWVGYQRDLTDKIGWRIQLNVRNAFASDGVIPISVQPDGETWASVRIKPNREWFLTNTFSF